jgi:hypothetical protein
MVKQFGKALEPLEGIGVPSVLLSTPDAMCE